jgi:signal transduction histidine kinase
LIDNAIKYSLDNPSVTISSEDRDGGVLLSFKDNGIGISRENQKKIFDRLYRVPTGNVHDVKGFGLGLSYVEAVIERHHGEIKVVSELNKGSTFKIYLPARHEKEA